MPSRRQQARSGSPLTTAAIVDAGIDLADADGLDALSMRRLADRLGVAPMSLYRHVDTKDQLLAAMRGHVLAKGVLVDGVNDLYGTLGLDKPDISLLDEQFLAQIREMPTKNLAAELRRRFDQAFWDEELGTYVLALDGDKRPCRVRSSNAGHALLTGIAQKARVPRLAAGLMQPSSFSGWGSNTRRRRRSAAVRSERSRVA